VLASAGATGITDPLAEQVMYPTASRLLQHCAAVLRLPGESRGADQDVAIAQARGLPVYTSIDEIPPAVGGAVGDGSVGGTAAVDAELVDRSGVS
jgi:hypothetical protein